jgi:DNA-binding NarL/FixJ family response regulator
VPGLRVREKRVGAGDLTRGELRVAEMAARGLANREIANELVVTVKAVEWHLSNAYRKLGVKSRRQLEGVLDERPLGG